GVDQPVSQNHIRLTDHLLPANRNQPRISRPCADKVHLSLIAHRFTSLQNPPIKIKNTSSKDALCVFTTGSPSRQTIKNDGTLLTHLPILVGTDGGQGQAGLLADGHRSLRLPVPKNSDMCAVRYQSQWRDRVGIAPTSLLSRRKTAGTRPFPYELVYTHYIGLLSICLSENEKTIPLTRSPLKRSRRSASRKDQHQGTHDE